MTDDFCKIGNCQCACIAAKVHTVDLGINPKKLPALFKAIEDFESACDELDCRVRTAKGFAALDRICNAYQEAKLEK